MDDGKDAGRKRKYHAFMEDKEHCGSIHAELTSLLDKRVQDVDAYVAKELRTLEEREAQSLEDHAARLASIQDREAALAAKDAELECLCKKLEQREAAIDAKSAKLQGLRTELLHLYDKLRSELPDLQARAKLAAKVQHPGMVAPAPEENSGSRLYQRQQEFRSSITAAQLQEQNQRPADEDADGASTQRHTAADTDPHMDSAAPAPAPISSMLGRQERPMQWDASASRRQGLNRADASRGQPARAAMPEACRPQQEQSSDHLQPSAFADVETLRNTAPTQHNHGDHALHSQQEHAQANPAQQQSLPARNAQHAQKPPQQKFYAQQSLFRPVVQQQRAGPKHKANAQSVTVSTDQDRGPVVRCKPVQTTATVRPPVVPLSHCGRGVPITRIDRRSQQAPGKAWSKSRGRGRTVGMSGRGEADELNGLVDSLRARCPALDEPRRSNDMPDAAAWELGREKIPAEALKAAEQTSVPDLVSTLKAQHILSTSALLQTSNTAPDAETALYEKVHGILSQYMSHHSAAGANIDEATHTDGDSPTHSGKRRYSPNALAILVEAAQQYQANGEPVTWGWCTELNAFVFVFETANRIVVEEPKFRHATYFFEIEEPLPLSCQVQRLIAVLSVPSIGRSALLHDKAPCFARELPLLDKAVLMSAGWTEEDGLRALLNFSGERVVHISDSHTAACTGESWERYRERLRQILSQGKAKGRLYKNAQRSARTQG